MFPTPSACEPDSWRYIEVVDKDGAPPSHPNQRFYNKATGQIVQKTLEHVAVAWPTPTVQDARNNGGHAQQDRRTPPLNARAGGPLNPEWVEWLMGFPAGWTALCRPAETDPRRGPSDRRADGCSRATEAARAGRPQFRPEAHREARRQARSAARRRAGDRPDTPLHRPDRAGSKTPRSNPHLEADS
jgi:hypothetical protein